MKKLLFALVAIFVWGAAAQAQNLSPATVNGCQYNPAFATLSAKQLSAFQCDQNGNLKVNATVNASVGGFAPGSAYATPLSVSSTSSNVALPVGAEIIVYNTGAVASYVTLGTSNAVAATTSDDVIQPGSWLAFATGSNTYLAAITSSSTTSLNISGGAGLPTGSGGGSSGGSGSNASVSTTGSAVPSSGTYIGMNVAGNLTGLTGTANGLKVDGSAVTQPVSGTVTANLGTLNGAATAANQTNVQGTAGSPTTTVLTVQGVSGGTAAPVYSAPTSSSSLAISHGAVTSLGTSLVAKASAGNLYGFNCTAITGGAAGYCVTVNAASVPSTGAITGVLDACYFNASAGGCSLARPVFPANYSTGIVILVTSAASPFTYTTGTLTAFISADYQ